MAERRTGWRKAGIVAGLTCALLLQASAVSAQAPTPTRPAPTPTRAAVSGSQAAGEPVQDMTMIAAMLGAMIVGGVALRCYAGLRA